MKKFTTAVNGYNKNEVNEFVSEIINEYESVLNKLKAKDQEIAMLKEKANYYNGMENSLNKALLVAESSSSEMRRVAKEEANLIIEDAKKNASRIINDSLTEAAKTNAEVMALKKQIKIYKARIKQTVEEQLIMVEDIDKID